MSRIFRSVCIFFFLLAGVATVVHMIIPHDHHLADPVTGQQDKCPASNGKSSHHTGFPVHCHAFNDLAAEKLSTFIYIKNIHSGFISVIRFSDLPDPELHTGEIIIFDSGKPFPYNYSVDSCPLRAPPSIS
jgi:hypothetical protein